VSSGYVLLTRHEENQAFVDRECENDKSACACVSACGCVYLCDKGSVHDHLSEHKL